MLLVGHGSSKLASAAASLARHAEALAAMGRFGEVAAATLFGGTVPPAAQLARLTRPTVVVVPMMMCAGFTAGQLLPQALGPAGGGRRLLISEPVGLHPALATLIAERAGEQARALGVPQGGVGLLLVAHGSLKHAASQQATELLAARLRALARFAAVATAYLEQPPRVADVLPRMLRPTLVVGCFAAPGHHVLVDIAAAIAGNAGVCNLGPIGDDLAMPQLIAAIAEDCLARSACPA